MLDTIIRNPQCANPDRTSPVIELEAHFTPVSTLYIVRDNDLLILSSSLISERSTVVPVENGGFVAASALRLMKYSSDFLRFLCENVIMIN